TYLLMRETYYNAGIFVCVLMFSRLIIKHRHSDPSIVSPPPAWQMKAASLMHIMLYTTSLALPLLGIALMAYSGQSWSF
ncbi:cytochrome b, partial [Escherichia coli]